MKIWNKILPLALVSIPSWSQCSSWDEGARLIEKLMNHPEISKTMPPPEPVARLEFRLYTEKFAYSKQTKRYLLQVISENGNYYLFFYDSHTDELSRVTEEAKYPNKLSIEFRSTQWFFFVSTGVNNARVD